jgi:Domain of unknown function (DUF5753)/Helix-turn-helix domain
LRDAALLTRAQAASHIHRSVSHIGYIETGRNPPTDLDELRQLAALYHANPDELAAMERLWADAKKDTWFSRFGLTDPAARYVGLETDAAVVRSWQSENIPGLLQTEEYLRARYRLAPHSQPDRETNKRIITRLHRQRRLAAHNDPLTLIAVISQSALDRCAHAGTVGRGQLAQLHERAGWPTVELRVLATKAGLHAGQDGPFSLLSFPDQLLPDMVYEEFVTGGHLTSTPAVVAECHTLFEELRGRSLGPHESMAMIAQLLDEQSHRKGP